MTLNAAIENLTSEELAGLDANVSSHMRVQIPSAERIRSRKMWRSALLGQLQRLTDKEVGNSDASLSESEDQEEDQEDGVKVTDQESGSENGDTESDLETEYGSDTNSLDGGEHERAPKRSRIAF